MTPTRLTPGDRVWIDAPGSPVHERVGTFRHMKGDAALVYLDGNPDPYSCWPAKPSQLRRLPFNG